ncbi:MAG: hypothetical protein J6D87_09480 [Clostridia bacterium]|nr:hypothetical protein [Clostridia bacterium]
MKKKLNVYEEAKIEILVLEVKDVITSSQGDPYPFLGEEQDFSGFFERNKGYHD